MARNPHLYAATYGLIMNDKNQILLSQRQNTGYYDGGRQFPAGHIEDGETTLESMKHECLEELGIHIDISEEDIFHIVHRIYSERQYFDVGIHITKRQGDIINNEPEKCIQLQRFSLDDLPSYITPTTLQFLNAYKSKIIFSELKE